MKPIRWGILSTANIAREHLIPAMQLSQTSEVVAITSRDPAKSVAYAEQMGIERAYGSYERLLEDVAVDAVYIPLPNDMHVDWAIRALESGKHVLCEKPLAMDENDVKRLIDASQRFPHLKVMEAFMYRFHPIWEKIHSLIADDVVGRVRSCQMTFTYSRHEPEDFRNRLDAGGGALMDVGCYAISAARLIYGSDPEKVIASVDVDSAYGVDKSVSALMRFADKGTVSFNCSTKTQSGQHIFISGEKASLYIHQPFYNDPTGTRKMTLKRDDHIEEFVFDNGNHYMSMVDHFNDCIVNDKVVGVPLSDSLINMRVIDALFTSVKEEAWIHLA